MLSLSENGLGTLGLRRNQGGLWAADGEENLSDESNTKGYHILDVESGSLDFFENEVSPRFVKTYISKIKSLDIDSITNNIVKLVVDEEVDDIKLEKVTNILNKLKPWQLTIDHNVVNKSLNDVESVDSINIKEMFEEFLVTEQNEWKTKKLGIQILFDSTEIIIIGLC